MNDISPLIVQKLPDVDTSIFTIMSNLANQHDAINLSQGFPDFAGSKILMNLVVKNLRKGNNQYSPMPGVLSLRENLVEKIEKIYNVKYNPENEITITAGATQAIYTAITTVIRDGDDVILFDPAYDCYAPAIRLNGGIPIHIELSPPSFRVDWDIVKKRITANTKMIIINSPHNPSGATFEPRDMQELITITKGTDIVIVSDEVYEHIIFDGISHQSVIMYPELYKRSFAIFSFGKVYHTTGWKLGYCVAPQHLMELFRKVHQFVVFTCNTPIQLALAEFIKKEEEYLDLAEFYQEKRDYFMGMIEGSRFNVIESKGTYFILLGYEEISSLGDFEYAKSLVTEHKIASIPLSVLYQNKTDHKLLRFCFAKTNETLEKGAKILCKI